ncbi:sensor histidine kinase [Clostridium sediminicola]|uniref:sensor histidine kinase n=1 Tax=Clostridium sediminicola TaxID=3114879 RepID=UPI003D166CE8
MLNTICLSGSIIMYLTAFSWAPAVLVSVYQRTTYLVYEQPNFNPSTIYTIYPYLCFICFVLLVWSSLKYKSSKKMMTSKYLSKENRLKKNNLGMRAFSHGLKNQLLAIQFESELLIDELDDKNKDLKESAETIYTIAKDTIKNLNLVHERMKTQSIILETMKINDFLKDFILDVKVQLPEKITLDYKLCQENPMTFLDEDHIKECLKIIIKNAIDAFEGEDGKITILSEVINEWVILSIKDNGIGMDEITKQNVFDPFYTTKTGDHNWGIGLYYVRQIVNALNGNVVVDSEKGKGTEIRILLPVVI